MDRGSIFLICVRPLFTVAGTAPAFALRLSVFFPDYLWPNHVEKGPTSLQTASESGLLWSAYVKEHRKVDCATLAFKNRQETTAFSPAESCFDCYLGRQDCGLFRVPVTTLFTTLVKTLVKTPFTVFLIIFLTFLLKMQSTRHGYSPAFRTIMPHRNLSSVLLSSLPGTIVVVGRRHCSRHSGICRSTSA